MKQRDKRICAYCNKEFIPKVSQQIYCKNPHYMTCPVCNKEYLVTNNDKLKFPPTACSYECRKVRARETNLKRYGYTTVGQVPEFQQKARQTMLDKYGVEFTLQSAQLAEKGKKTLEDRYGVSNPMQNEMIKEKVAETNMQKYGSTTYLTSEQGKAEYKKILKERYGVEHPIQNEEIKSRIKATMQERYGAEWFSCSKVGKYKIKRACRKKYGVDYVVQAPEVKAKIKQSFIRKYGVDNPSKHPDVIEKIRQTFLARYGTTAVMHIPEIRDKIAQTTMERYNVPFYIMKEEVRRSSGAISKINLAYKQKLENAGIECKMEYSIDSYSYDFLLPDHNLVVEINPTYTHGLLENSQGMPGRPMNYHFDKAIRAIDNGIDIRCIFDWDVSLALIEELSSPVVELSSSNYQAYLLNRKPGIKFLKKYGRCRLDNYPRKMMIWGLVSQDEIQQAIAIGADKENGGYVLLDFGTRWGVQIPDDYNGLLTLIKTMFDLNEIRMNIDIDRIVQAELDSLNMCVVGYTSPNLFWSKKSDRIRFKRFNSSNYHIEEGWWPVEDCGQAICVFNKNYIDSMNY